MSFRVRNPFTEEVGVVYLEDAQVWFLADDEQTPRPATDQEAFAFDALARGQQDVQASIEAVNEDAETARDLMVALSKLRRNAEDPTTEHYQDAYSAASAAMFRYSGLVFTGEPSNKTRDLFLLVQARSIEALTNG